MKLVWRNRLSIIKYTQRHRAHSNNPGERRASEPNKHTTWIIMGIQYNILWQKDHRGAEDLNSLEEIQVMYSMELKFLY